MLSGITGKKISYPVFMGHNTAEKSLNTDELSGQTVIANNTGLPDSPYGRALIQNSRISFKANDLVPSFRPETPLEKDIANLLKEENLQKGEAILIGNNPKRALDELKDEKYDLVTKVVHMNRPEINGCIMLFQEDNGYTKIINHTGKPVQMGNISVSDGNFSDLGTGNRLIRTDNIKFRIFKEYKDLNPDTCEKDYTNLAAFSNTLLKEERTLINNKRITSLMEKLGLSKADTKNVDGGPKFSDVGGLDDKINELKKAVLYPLTNPEYAKLKGKKLNRGVILYGPSGTGKTLLAEALANEAGVSLITIKGPELLNKYIGATEENYRKKFEEAIEKQPAILFIDEIDAVTKERKGGDSSSRDDETNQMLVLMDEIYKRGHNVFIIGTTNRLDLLDDALLRPGRFGDKIEIPNPRTSEACKHILDVHMNNIPASNDFDREEFSKKLLKFKFSGAEIEKVVLKAMENAEERLDIFKLLEKGLFTKEEAKKVKVIKQDFDKAFEVVKKDKKVKKSEGLEVPIGFRKNSDED